MSLSIWIIKGKDEGYRFQVQDGLSIGRSKADIVIDDPKISSRHAKIEIRENAVYLVDTQSTNKIVYKGEVFDELLLEDGIRFHLGDTYMEAIQEKEAPLSENTHWSNKIKEIIKAAQKESETDRKDIYPLPQAVRLSFIKGLSKSSFYDVFYGPRKLGVNESDLVFKDWSLENVNIFLEKHKDKTLLRVKTDLKVKINGKHTNEKVLDSGDLIEFGDNLIEVEFI